MEPSSWFVSQQSASGGFYSRIFRASPRLRANPFFCGALQMVGDPENGRL